MNQTSKDVEYTLSCILHKQQCVYTSSEIFIT